MQKLYNHSKTNIADVNQKKKLQLLTISRQKGGSKIYYIECRGVGGRYKIATEFSLSIQGKEIQYFIFFRTSMKMINMPE